MYQGAQFKCETSEMWQSSSMKYDRDQPQLHTNENKIVGGMKERCDKRAEQ